jgi:hypothetical protein
LGILSTMPQNSSFVEGVEAAGVVAAPQAIHVRDERISGIEETGGVHVGRVDFVVLPANRDRGDELQRGFRTEKKTPKRSGSRHESKPT